MCTMPASRKNIMFPEWVENTPDACLSEALKEALLARNSAIGSGVLKSGKACKASFESAENTIEQIEFGRVHGSVACRKAATAMRKYTVAAECAEPTAKKSS